MRRALKWLLVLMLLGGLALALVAWLATRTATLAWLLERAATFAGGTFSVTALQGSLLGPVRADELVFESDQVRVALDKLRFDWAGVVPALRERRVSIRSLQVAQLSVDQKTRSSGPASPPESLALPVPIAIERIAVDRLVISSPLSRFEAERLRARFAGDEDELRLALESLVTRQGELTGEAKIGARPPFPIEGAAKVKSANVELPFQAEASIGGELALIGMGGFATVDFGTARGALVLTPFAATLVERIEASTEAFDPAKVRREWPTARLDVAVRGGMRGDDRFVGRVAVVNRAPGTVDAKRLPVARLEADVDITEVAIALSGIAADLGRAGRAAGTARYENSALTFELSTDRLDLAGLHSGLHATRLAGRVSGVVGTDAQRLKGNLADARLAFDFDAERSLERIDVRAFTLRAGAGRIDATGRAELTGEGRFETKGVVSRFDPAVFGQLPRALVNAEFEGAGRWLRERDGRFEFRVRDSQYRGAAVLGTGSVAFQEQRVTALDVDALFGGNRVTAKGALGAPGDELRWSVGAANLARLGIGVEGRVRASGIATGSWDAIASDFSVGAEALVVPGQVRIGELSADGRYAADRATARIAAKRLARGELAIATLDAALEGTTAEHRLELRAAGIGDARTVGGQLEASASGGLHDDGLWRGTIDRLRLSAPIALQLKAPAKLEAGAERLRLEAAQFSLLDGEARIDSFVQSGPVTQTRGQFTGIAAQALLRGVLAASSTLKLGGNWEIDAGQSLNGSVTLRRESGDLRFVDDYESGTLGLARLDIDLDADRNRLSGTLAAAGERLGTLTAQAGTIAALRDGRWGIPGIAPVSGSARLDMASIAWLSAFTRGSALLDGGVRGAIELTGTIADPQPSGTLRGERLRVTLPDENIVLSRGSAEVAFDRRVATIRDAIFYGDEGSVRASGNVALLAPFDGELKIDFDRLDAISDPARSVKVSGALLAKMAKGTAAVTGKLRADEGRLRLPEADAPRLGDDVVVRRRGEDPKTKVRRPDSTATLRLTADVGFDLGDRFRLQGRGVDAWLSGQIQVRATESGLVRIFGPVKVERGTVSAYGQTLTIERGTVTFNGPLDNPQLNLVAIRSGLPVRVGVQVTGFALEPRAALFSDPVMPDSERLAWLVLGRSSEALSPTDLTLLGTAASALMSSSDAVPLQTRIANAVGLDELAVRSADALESTIVAVGKRLSDKLYVSVERNLLGLGTVLALRYQFNRNWSLQGRTGFNNTVDLFYTISFD
jgi:translocation and assembly module TamB